MNRYPLSVRLRILLRSFSIQGSWNYETLIGTGYTYSLLPALRYLYGNDGKRLQEAVSRHLGLFNSHPYFATVAIGAIGTLEADGVEPMVIERFKLALRGSLGSLGDRLIWSAWRPMAVLLGLVLLLSGAVWWLAVVVFLAVYNTLHLAVRIMGLRLGSDAGLELGRVLREAPIQPLIERASKFACTLAGLAVVLAARPAFEDVVQLGVVFLATGFGFLMGADTRRSLLLVLAATILIALLRGLAGNGA